MESKIDMKALKNYLKKNGITFRKLSEESGYSQVYMSLIFNEKAYPSEKFFRLVMPFLIEHATEKTKEFKKVIEGTKWIDKLTL